MAAAFAFIICIHSRGKMRVLTLSAPKKFMKKNAALRN